MKTSHSNITQIQDSGTNKTVICLRPDAQSRCTLRASELHGSPCGSHLTLDDMGKCQFNENWLFNQDFAAWLKPVRGTVYVVMGQITERAFVNLAIKKLTALKGICVINA